MSESSNDAPSHRFSFCGLIAPIESLEPYSDSRLANWLTLRNAFSRALIEHAQKCGNETANQRYFYAGFALCTRRLIQLTEQLGSAWADLHGVMCGPASNSSALLLLSGNHAFKFSWSYCRLATATLTVNGELKNVTAIAPREDASYSLFVESIALRYVHVALLLQLSIYFSVVGRQKQAASFISDAIQIARRCSTSVRRQADLQKATPALYHTPPFADTTCWNKWLAALLLSQARYTQSDGALSRVAEPVAYDSEHLIKLALDALPDELIDQQHRVDTMHAADKCKSHLLLQMARKLAVYALAASDEQSIQTAAAIIYWHAVSTDATYTDLRQELDAEFFDLTGVLPQRIFNNNTPIDQIRYDAENRAAVWSNGTLYLPAAVSRTRLLDEKTAN